MAETEVETILREIRERIVSEQRAGHDVAAANAQLTSGGNGAGELSSGRQIAPSGDGETFAGGNLALVNSYLTTTARAWDRLPPVVSNRHGLVARLELWLKGKMKRATRWYAWEQVNFNAAVHHALRDMLPVLSAYEAELRKLSARLATAEAATQAETEARQTEAQQYRIGLAAQLKDLKDLRTREDQLAAQLEALVNELRERDAHLRDEQRVCYKQLALETTEAAVLEDRARRKTEALLEELQQRVQKLEK
jgi:hypothetical protein